MEADGGAAVASRAVIDENKPKSDESSSIGIEATSEKYISHTSNSMLPFMISAVKITVVR